MTHTLNDTEHKGERDVRIAKVQKMKEMGIIPYAQGFGKKDLIGDIIQNAEGKSFRDINDIIPSPEHQVTTAGRVMLYRSHGKLAFAKLLDSTGEIQLMFHRDNCKIIVNNELREGNEQITSNANLPTGQAGAVSELPGDVSAYKFMEKFVDMGDFIGVQGEVFQTHKGELTIFVSAFMFLSKAVRPLPEKFHGLQDQEELYRKRYLDLTMNPKTYERFLLKSKFYQTLRNFYTQEGFVEVQTNILGNSASGAAARPFITHHNDYDTDVYLRIAFETGLKKATVGRFEKVFEIGQDFRNEGSDPSHLQEFTQVEHYAAYWNYEDNMRFTEKMFDYLFDQLHLPKKFEVKDKEGKPTEVDFTTPWERIDFTKGIEKASGIDITKYSMDDADALRKDIKAKKIDFEGMEKMGTPTLIDYLYKKVLRPKIIGPAFIYNYPVIMQPLARVSDKDTGIVEQFQLLVNGREICKAYSELVDPLLQQANFDSQAEAAAKGDDEATAGDDDFVTAMEYGMPPQSGFGMGLERILAILTQQDNLRDVVLFPLMKPEEMGRQHGDEETGKIEEIRRLCGDREINSKIINPQIPTKSPNHQQDPQITSDYGTLPDEQAIKNLMDKYLTETKQHCEVVGKVMRYFAKKLGQDEHIRYTVGLLHDVDRDHIAKDASSHMGEIFENIMKEGNFPAAIIQDIQSHYTAKTAVPVDSLIRKYLISVDELSGFITAVSLMRPNGLADMEAKSVTKRIKDKAFARAINREDLLNCEKYLNIPVADFVTEMIEAMK